MSSFPTKWPVPEFAIQIGKIDSRRRTCFQDSICWPFDRYCLDRLILFGEKALRNAVNQYLAHYHAERPHQGLGNDLIVPKQPSPSLKAEIETTERLGGLLRSYRRAA